MADRARIAFVTLLLVAPVVAGYVALRHQNEAEIARVEAQFDSLAVERDSILAIVAANTLAQQELQLQRDSAHRQAAELRDSVDVLERKRREAQLTVRQIRRTSDLQTRLEETFPEMANSAWGITSIPFEEGDTLGIEYFLIPAWFTETFIIDHLNAESWREQKDKLLSVDSLRLRVISLQDSIARLHIINAAALQTGYDNCYGEFYNLSQRYLARLRRPTFSLGSTVALCGGAAGLGFIAGLVIYE